MNSISGNLGYYSDEAVDKQEIHSTRIAQAHLWTAGAKVPRVWCLVLEQW